MSQAISLNQSTWASKLKAMGPGILMATAAVGGSHIVSSTQAGGSYGWSLLLLVILANVFKYPFFRFGAEYTADTGKTLVEGYAEKGRRLKLLQPNTSLNSWACMPLFLANGPVT